MVAKTAKKMNTKVSPVPSYKLYEGDKAINNVISSIKNHSKKLDNTIHITALSVINHIEKHGDITLAQKLVSAVPGSSRKAALNDWLLKFGKLNYDTEKKTLTFARDKKTNLEGGMETPFWELEVATEYKPYDVIKALEAIYRKANQAKARGDNISTDILLAVDNIVKGTKEASLTTVTSSPSSAKVA
jgi:hypothetical protein